MMPTSGGTTVSSIPLRNQAAAEHYGRWQFDMANELLAPRFLSFFYVTLANLLGWDFIVSELWG